MKKKNHLPCAASWLCAMLIAFFLVTGLVYMGNDNIVGLLFEYVRKLPVWIAAAVALAFGLDWLTDPHREVRLGRAEDDALLRRGSFVAVLAVYMIYIAAFYPGCVGFDGSKHLLQSVGYEALDDHHTVAVTWFFGLLFKIGRSLVDDRFGVFLIVTVDAVLVALVCSKCVNEVRRMGLGRRAAIGLTVFYALHPLYGIFVQTVDKGVPYSAFFMLFMLYVCRFLSEKRRMTRGETAGLLLSGLMMCLTRHEGVLIVAPTLVLMSLAGGRENRFRLAAVLVAITLPYGIYQHEVNARLGSDGAMESGSLIYQTTAHYMKMYPEEITAEDFAIIDKVLDAKNAAWDFSPMIADNVKNKFRLESTAEDRRAYLQLWVRQFLRHPLNFVDTLLHTTFGYVYPFFSSVLNGYSLQSMMREDVVNAGFDYFHTNPQGPMQFFIAVMQTIQFTPWLVWLISPGTFTWLACILALMLIRKHNWRQMIALVPPLLVIAICILSPVNGNPRYMLPWIAAVPFTLLWVIAQRNRSACANNIPEDQPARGGKNEQTREGQKRMFGKLQNSKKL